MTISAPTGPVAVDDQSGARSGVSLTPEATATRAIVVALQRVRLTGLPVEIRHIDHTGLSEADLLALAETVRDREQAAVRILWTGRFDGLVFEPDPQRWSDQHEPALRDHATGDAFLEAHRQQYESVLGDGWEMAEPGIYRQRPAA